MGKATAAVTFTEPTANDNSGVAPQSSSTHSPGDEFTIGDTTVTYTFTDSGMNSADCSFNVTVNGKDNGHI